MGVFGSKTEKTKSGGSGFVPPPVGVNDNFDIGFLKAIIEFLKEDLKDSDKWIQDYITKKEKFKNNLNMRVVIDKMIAHELKGKHDTNIQLSYYERELIEEINKEKHD